MDHEHTLVQLYRNGHFFSGSYGNCVSCTQEELMFEQRKKSLLVLIHHYLLDEGYVLIFYIFI